MAETAHGLTAMSSCNPYLSVSHRAGFNSTSPWRRICKAFPVVLGHFSFRLCLNPSRDAERAKIFLKRSPTSICVHSQATATRRWPSPCATRSQPAPQKATKSLPQNLKAVFLQFGQFKVSFVCGILTSCPKSIWGKSNILDRKVKKMVQVFCQQSKHAVLHPSK